MSALAKLALVETGSVVSNLSRYESETLAHSLTAGSTPSPSLRST